MNYLLKNNYARRKGHFSSLFAAVVFLVVVLLINYIKPDLLSPMAHAIGSPFFKLKSMSGERLGGMLNYFRSKDTLARENLELKSQIEQLKPALLSFDSIKKENDELKSELGRYSLKEKVLGYVIEGPGISPYDTLIIDIGKKNGVKNGDKVILGEYLLIGYIQETFYSTSKVKLFSSSGEEVMSELSSSHAVVKSLGRGGGNFEIKTPKNIEVKKGEIISLPGEDSSILGIVESVEALSADSMQLIIARSPFNIYEVNRVYVIK